MISRNKFIFWALIALLSGFSGGYLFSTKFCTVSINTRVEKKLALNQTLRDVLAKHLFFTHHYIKSLYFDLPDKEALIHQLENNRHELTSIIDAYYSKTSSQTLDSLLAQKDSLLCLLIATNEPEQLNKVVEQFQKNSNKISLFFAQSNPESAQNIIMIENLLNTSDWIVQTKKAFTDKNWTRVQILFENQFENTMQLADEINRGIIKQFPEKF